MSKKLPITLLSEFTMQSSSEYEVRHFMNIAVAQFFQLYAPTLGSAALKDLELKFEPGVYALAHKCAFEYFMSMNYYSEKLKGKWNLIDVFLDYNTQPIDENGYAHLYSFRDSNMHIYKVLEKKDKLRCYDILEDKEIIFNSPGLWKSMNSDFIAGRDVYLNKEERMLSPGTIPLNQAMVDVIMNTLLVNEVYSDFTKAIDPIFDTVYFDDRDSEEEREHLQKRLLSRFVMTKYLEVVSYKG